MATLPMRKPPAATLPARLRRRSPAAPVARQPASPASA
jgi:hypothetical protein